MVTTNFLNIISKYFLRILRMCHGVHMLSFTYACLYCQKWIEFFIIDIVKIKHRIFI